MPYFRRLPKFGFTNAPFKVRFWTVNLGDIVAHPSFASGGAVNADTLIAAGLVRDTSRGLKVLGDLKDAKGLKVKLSVEAARVTGPARKLIVDAGGSVKETGSRRDRVRGIDLTTEDRKPTKLTKKLKRGGPKKAAAPAAEEPASGDAKKGEGKGGKKAAEPKGETKGS